MYLNTGEVVRGVIRSVYPNEIIVDLGTKCTGLVSSSDIDTDKISIGDEREFIIIKVSDADGICYLEEKEHYMKRKNMIDNNTIKEICDVVTEEVINKIRQELSAMKPELIQAITEASTAKAIEEIRKNDEPEKRISQHVPPASAIGDINTLSAAEIDDIFSYTNRCCEANGWLYYIKIIKGKNGKNIHGKIGELYKVRPDGTENQKIFADKVSVNGTLFLNGNILSFRDSDFNPRRIKV